MIPIRRKNLHQLAERHLESILEYAKRSKATSFTMDQINTFDIWLKHKFDGLSFERLILAKPEMLDEIANTFEGLKMNVKNEGHKINFTLQDIDINIIFKIPELYEKFSPKDSSMKLKDGNSYSGSVLVESLGLTVCPYCNRNFINTIYELTEDNINSPKAIERRTSQLDHFYPKSTFPILAMSFYNLIPSCMVCNFIKKDITEVGKYYNPYDTRFDGNKAFRFQLKIKSTKFYYDSKEIDIVYPDSNNSEEQERVNANLKLFRVKELYNEHKDIVLDLIQKDIAYNDSYIDELYKKYEGSLFKNREDVLRMITANYITEDELEKRPLAKLTRDIAEELGLI